MLTISKMTLKATISFLVLSILILSSYTSIAQTYTSYNNSSGLWSDGNSWQRSATWMLLPPERQGGSTIDVYGIISTTSDLAVGNRITINIFDTLIINGNFTFDGGATLNIASTGVLIIRGNLGVAGKSIITNHGRIAVTGNTLSTGGGEIKNEATGENGFYAFGNTTSNNGGKITSNPFYNEQQMMARDFPLWNYVVNGATILPVEILFFTAKTETSSIVLKWATSSEKDFDYFSIERSSDLSEWESVGEITGAGTSIEVVHYSFEDQSPLNGKAYYRLKATDFDGFVEYHEVIAATFSGSFTVGVFPNPLNEGPLYVHAGQDSGKVRIVNLMGIAIHHSNLHPGKNEISFAQSLERGFYVVVVTQGDSEQKMRLKVN